MHNCPMGCLMHSKAIQFMFTTQYYEHSLSFFFWHQSSELVWCDPPGSSVPVSLFLSTYNIPLPYEYVKQFLQLIKTNMILGDSISAPISLLFSFSAHNFLPSFPSVVYLLPYASILFQVSSCSTTYQRPVVHVSKVHLSAFPII